MKTCCSIQRFVVSSKKRGRNTVGNKAWANRHLIDALGDSFIFIAQVADPGEVVVDDFQLGFFCLVDKEAIDARTDKSLP